jgi:hypothetical protein
MTASKHLTLSYYYNQKQNKIITPVTLQAVPFNSSNHLNRNIRQLCQPFLADIQRFHSGFDIGG